MRMDAPPGSGYSGPHSPMDDSALSNRELIRRLLALTWEYRAGCIRVVALQLLLLALGLAGLGFAGVGIDVVRFQVQPGARPPAWPFGLAPPADWGPVQVLALLAGGILGVAVIRALLNYAVTVQASRLVQRKIVVDLRARVYDKLQRLSFRFFDENASGSIINRVTRDVQGTRMFVDSVMMQSVVMILSLVVYAVYMVSIHLPLTAVCLLTTPLLAYLAATFSRRVRPAYLRNRELVDDLVRVLSEGVRGIRVIKSFARESEAVERFRKANRSVRDQNFWIFGQVSRFGPTIGFVTQVNLVLLLGYGGHLVLRGELALGTGMVVFAGLLQQFSAQVANISNIANSIQESLTAARRVFEVLDAPIEIQSAPGAVRRPRLEGGVTFDRVTFGYRDGTVALHEVDFTAAPGDCVAILGSTGSGKSTLLSLIARFYDPTAGRVLIDGIDARDLDLDDLRRNIGLVFQENFLFSNTVAANIAFGHPDATAEQVERAARITAAHGFITRLPNGYQTLLGEDGVDLSGGQRQRLALARAILLEPAILLLDDPTAAIDAGTESEILDAMEAAMRGRTTFVVAHRLSTLRRADRILVLSGGRIVESGTHDELMARDGTYRQTARLQLADFEDLQVLEAGR